MNSIFCYSINCGCRKLEVQCCINRGFCRGHSWTFVNSDDATGESCEEYDDQIDIISMLSADMNEDDTNNTEKYDEGVNGEKEEQQEEKIVFKEIIIKNHYNFMTHGFCL